jgi:hypothetical protein
MILHFAILVCKTETKTNLKELSIKLADLIEEYPVQPSPLFWGSLYINNFCGYRPFQGKKNSRVKFKKFVKIRKLYKLALNLLKVLTLIRKGKKLKISPSHPLAEKFWLISFFIKKSPSLDFTYQF